MARYCGNCGAQVDDDARVCGQCGTPIDGTTGNVSGLKVVDPEKKKKMMKKMKGGDCTRNGSSCCDCGS